MGPAHRCLLVAAASGGLLLPYHDLPIAVCCFPVATCVLLLPNYYQQANVMLRLSRNPRRKPLSAHDHLDICIQELCKNFSSFSKQ